MGKGTVETMIQFGTGGWRAIIGDEFIKQNVQLLTIAIAKTMKRDGIAERGIVIGYDRRFLSKEAAQWAAQVMAAQEIPCLFINRQAPTPLVMFAVKRRKLPFGMAITASHNPAIYNGVKVFMKGGRDADEALTEDLERMMASLEPEDVRELPLEEALASGAVQLIDPMNEYIDSIIGALDMEAIRERRLRIVLDPMYGVSKTALQTILLTARCDVEVIHERHDTLFGGRLPAPNHKTLASLMTYVEEKHSDIGIATDGDADRLGIVDDHAQFLHPNTILVLLYHYLLRYKGWRGCAVRNIATTHLLDRIAEAYGEACYEVPVGFKYISSKMAETNAVIGGESSGGLTVRGHIQGKDGIYAAALLVEMIAKTGKSLSALCEEIKEQYGSFEMTENDYRFSEAEKQRIADLLFKDKLLPEFPHKIERVSYLDGCKVYFQNGGWIITRFSGTEPLLRVFCEMPTLQEASQTSDLLAKFLSL